MRVAVYYSNKDVRLEEMPKPDIGKGEMLVKVIASGICGSDVMEWYRIQRAPLVLGHEIAGDVEEVGDGVEAYKPGDRVFVSHHVPCGKCQYCLSGHDSTCDLLRSTNYFPGGFAEYIRVPKVNVEKGIYALPKKLTYEDGVFIEPLACVVRGFKLGGFTPGQTVLTIGSGIAGLLNVKLAKAMKAGKVLATDVSEYRMKAAKSFGADAVIEGTKDVPALVRKANGNRLADMVVVCTGASSALEQAFRCVDRGGTVLLFAPPLPGMDIPVPLNDLWKDEVTITSTYAGGPEDITDAIRFLRTGKVAVRDMVTHRLGLAETGKGFELVANARESIKVIIEPQR